MPTLFNNEMKVEVHDFLHYFKPRKRLRICVMKLQSLYCMSVYVICLMVDMSVYCVMLVWHDTMLHIH